MAVVSAYKPGDRVCWDDVEAVVEEVETAEGASMIRVHRTGSQNPEEWWGDTDDIRPSTAPLPAWLQAIVDRETAALRERAEDSRQRAAEAEADAARLIDEIARLRAALSARPAPEHYTAAIEANPPCKSPGCTCWKGNQRYQGEPSYPQAIHADARRRAAEAGS